MSIYSTIYHNLCQQRTAMKEQYGPGSGLHCHHIIPKHSGGEDIEENYTYLTVREHIIAHFLLWKMYGNPNDLRSMKMLGAKLTPAQRRATGIFCRDNKIGFHGASEEQRREWRLNGFLSQKESGDTNSFYWWSTEEGRRKRASMGGKASIASGNNEKWAYWSSPEGRKKRASLGGKSHKGKIAMTNGKHRTRIKPELVNEYIDKGYRRGFTLSSDT